MRRAQDPFAPRAHEVDYKAAQWVVCTDLRGAPDERSALKGWLERHPRHRAAFLRLSVAWARADALRKLRPMDGIVDPDLLEPVPLETDPPDDEGLPAHGLTRAREQVPADEIRFERLWGEGRARRAAAGAPLAIDISSFAAIAASTLGGLILTWELLEALRIEVLATPRAEFGFKLGIVAVGALIGAVLGQIAVHGRRGRP